MWDEYQTYGRALKCCALLEYEKYAVLYFWNKTKKHELEKSRLISLCEFNSCGWALEIKSVTYASGWNIFIRKVPFCTKENDNCIYCYCLRGGIAQRVPYTTTITDLLCFPTWVLNISGSSTRAIWQYPQEAPSSKAGSGKKCLWI
jgi:hypothetical protein